MKIEEAVEKKYSFILVGCNTAKERDGMSELWHVLIKYCNIAPIEAYELPIRGLYLIAISENPQEIIASIGSIVAEKKFEFQISRKFIPIDQLIDRSLDLLAERIAPYLEKIPKKAQWKITVNRRHTKLKKPEIIDKIVQLHQVPKGKVNLSDPDWEIIIEVFGRWIGFSVCPANSILKIHEPETQNQSS